MAKKQNKNDKKYWSKRTELREKQSMNLTEETLKRIQEQYDEIAEKIQQEINLLYSKYANENGLTISEAKIRLTSKEKEDLLVSIKKYAELAQSGDETYKELLDRISARVRISRLEAINFQIDTLQESLFSNISDEIDKTFAENYTDAYYKKIYDMQSRWGQGKNFQLLDTRTQNVLSSYIDKLQYSSFSESLWKNTAKMTNEWKKILEVGITTGASQYEMTKKLSDVTGVMYRNARTLVRTESSHFHSQAQIHAFYEQEVEKYQFIATLDSVTTMICQEHDLKEYFVNDAETGVNLPPMHYNCRSTILEVLPTWMKDIQGKTTRIARDNVGNTYSIPSDMTYKEWYDTYVAKKDNIKGAKYQGNIDVNDAKEVDKTLKKFENKFVNEKSEHAAVITAEGDVYQIKGKTRSVDVTVMGDKLKGAFVTHNHPKKYTEYGFSKDDLRMFNEYELNKLRGVDYKYVYELERTKHSKVITEFKSEWDNARMDALQEYFTKQKIFDESHDITINLAKKFGFKYWRK